ncbi:MAG: hypothetical protein ACRELY_02755 [Polyangiaceae bacterium]
MDSFWKAAFDPFLRAMKGMSVTRKGDVVRLSIETKLTPEESKSLHEFLATRTTDQAAKGRIVDALLQGTPVAEADLAVFVDDPIAKWMVAPKATAADCQTLRDRVKKVAANASVDQFGLKFRQEKRFADAQCIGASLPPEGKQCVLAASDLNAIAACRVVTSVAVAVASSKVEGQWVLEIPAEGPMVGSRLEVGSSKIAFAVPVLPPMVTNTEIESVDGNEFVISVPIPNGSSVRMKGTITKEGKLCLDKDDLDKPELTFRSASFNPSLLADGKK